MPSEEQHLQDCVYSMVPIVKIYLFLYQIKASKNSVRSKQERGRERKREME